MPRGVHPRWLDVIRTLITRNRNGNNDGIAIISINIIVDGNGTPSCGQSRVSAVCRQWHRQATTLPR